MKLRTAIVLVFVLGILGALAWGAMRIVRATNTSTEIELPTTRVKRGRVILTVNARGELQGGNSEMLTAPQTGGGDMAITYLREPGELVNPGDVVVQFDTTEQDYRLKEAEADFDEAQQQVIKAEADSEATEEESRFAMLSAQSDVRLAENELRRNPLIPAINARQNDLALEAARNKERQTTQDYTNKKTTSAAGITIQKAVENKARVAADIAKKNIENMTLKAKTGGYVNVQQNMNQNMMYWGMQLPPYQLGDTTNAGMAVAQIPDLKNWEVSANVGELDRGHLNPGQKVTVRVVALPHALEQLGPRRVHFCAVRILGEGFVELLLGERQIAAPHVLDAEARIDSCGVILALLLGRVRTGAERQRRQRRQRQYRQPQRYPGLRGDVHLIAHG